MLSTVSSESVRDSYAAVRTFAVMCLADRTAFDNGTLLFDFNTAHSRRQQKLPDLSGRRIKQFLCLSRSKQCAGVGYLPQKNTSEQEIDRNCIPAYRFALHRIWKM